MVNQIKWRKKALRSIKETAEYLELNFSLQTANNFVESITKTIDKVSKNPQTFRKVPNSKSIHFVNIDKSHQLFYRMEGRTLIVSAFFDTRQSPKKRPF
jgi:plasmid stabilization system protein ParE